jgi:drug/metabolite transporter (DMT)-like permease
MALAVTTVDASHGGVVMGALPIATAFVTVLITHERPRPLFWIASLAGAALVVALALRQGGGSLTSGDLLLFAAMAASAIGYAFTPQIALFASASSPRLPSRRARGATPLRVHGEIRQLIPPRTCA